MDTKNEDIVSRYFDIVQDEIKKLISEDKEIKPDEVQKFNDEIFNQEEEIQGQMRQYIDKATMNDLDIKKVAKIIYDKFKLQVKNNVFNQDDVNNVPNPMIGERRYIKTFEDFKKIMSSAMITEYTKYVNKFDFEIGKSYEYDELPEKTKDDIDVQFDDNAEYGPDDYVYVFKLLTPEETEDYLHNQFGEYDIEDAMDDPYMKALIKKIIRVGLDYPAVGIEGNHRALACYTLRKPLPYLEMKLKPEIEDDNEV